MSAPEGSAGPEWRERARDTVATARRLRQRHEGVLRAAEAALAEREAHLRAAEALRPGGGPFTVGGLVEGRECRLHWDRGRLSGDLEAVERARLVVSLHRGVGTAPRPSLVGSRTQALLAAMRAFDRVAELQVTLDVDDLHG